MVAPFGGASPTDRTDETRKAGFGDTPSKGTAVDKQSGPALGIAGLGDELKRQTPTGASTTTNPLDARISNFDPKAAQREMESKDALFQTFVVPLGKEGIKDWNVNKSGDQAGWQGHYTAGMQALQRHLGVPETGKFDALTYATIQLTGSPDQKNAAQALAIQQPWWNADMHNGGVSPQMLVDLHKHRDDPPNNSEWLKTPGKITDPPPDGFDPSQMFKLNPTLID